MRKSLSLSFAATAALFVAGTAYAQSEASPEAPAKARGEPRGPTTRAEAEQRSTQMFGRMDANSDGVLNAADREAVRRKAFDSVDTDKDGTISFAEFEARRGDRNQTRAERGAASGERGFGRRGGPRSPGMARAADADQDGTVTQAEFTTAALARFDRADADKDGTISLEERRDARHHGRHDRRRGGPAARDAG
jgi:Ca2+-binding EF-hand superfamily protein